MDRACSMNGEKGNPYRLLVGNPEGKRSLGRARHCISTHALPINLILSNLEGFIL
jgi:hypothetical protein